MHKEREGDSNTPNGGERAPIPTLVRGSKAFAQRRWKGSLVNKIIVGLRNIVEYKHL